MSAAARAESEPVRENCRPENRAVATSRTCVLLALQQCLSGLSLGSRGSSDRADRPPQNPPNSTPPADVPSAWPSFPPRVQFLPTVTCRHLLQHVMDAFVSAAGTKARRYIAIKVNSLSDERGFTWNNPMLTLVRKSVDDRCRPHGIVRTHVHRRQDPRRHEPSCESLLRGRPGSNRKAQRP